MIRKIVAEIVALILALCFGKCTEIVPEFVVIIVAGRVAPCRSSQSSKIVTFNVNARTNKYIMTSTKL